jgi:hypothetical protein
VNLTEVLIAPSADVSKLAAAREAIAALGVTVHQPNEAIGVETARLRARHLRYYLPRCLHGRPNDRLVVAVEYVGIEVVAVRPYDGAKFGIDAHLAEVGRVLQRLSHRPPKIAREIDLADQSVGERQPQPEALQRLDGGDPGKKTKVAHGSGSMLASGVRA